MKSVLLLLASFSAAWLPSHTFNLETEKSHMFQTGAEWFGHQVLQMDSGGTWVAVSSPLEDNKNGKIYQCSYNNMQCSALEITGTKQTERWAMGMSLVSSSKQLVGCGPHYEHLCGKNMYLNGVCYRFDRELQTTASRNITPGYQECTVRGIDIVFLIDGSGSVLGPDFQNMKVFMMQIINKFSGRNTNFAVVQFSSSTRVEFNFRQYLSSSSPNILINAIVQMSRGTNTVSGMRYVVDNIFAPSTGSRTDATKILITITDGESQEKKFEEVTRRADAKNIIRYAIGVGGAFAHQGPRNELNTIASSPNNVFRVDDFNALNGIQSQLEERIFSIEGTQKDTLASSFQLELSQGGFSLFANSDGSVLYGAVGSYDWSGGFFEENGHILKFFNMSSHSRDMKGSYLGYTIEDATVSGATYYFVGAPRYKHKGAVVVFQRHKMTATYTLEGEQIGSYFGAVICSVDLNKNGETDLLLISAPMYQSPGKGGQVFVYKFSSITKRFALSDTLNGMEGQPDSRFGASIAEISDLNGDGITDVAVGAPLENDGRGSVYIFNGGAVGLRSCSQRIEAAQLSGNLRLFGHSLHGILDLTGDQMPDLTIGSKGNVVVLRSRPVLGVEVTAAFQPEIINTKDEDCARESKHKMTLCFIVTKVTKDNAANLSATITYNLTLDSVRQRFRAHFTPGNRQMNSAFKAGVGRTCKEHNIIIPNCPDDFLIAITNELIFTMVGEPIPSASGLQPVLDMDSKTKLLFPLSFEKNCGPDQECIDFLQLSFNTTGDSFLGVGISPILNLTVSIQNDNEDSYNTVVTFTYPSGLSYRRATVLQADRRMTVHCDSTPGKEGDVMMSSSCAINKPVFRAGAKALFIATFDVAQNAEFNRVVNISALATSENKVHQGNERFYSMEIPVKYAINILVKNKIQETTRYINFSMGQDDITQAVEHVYEVENTGLREVSFTAVLKIPIRLQDKELWSSLATQQKTSCTETLETPRTITAAELKKMMKKDTKVDCTIAVCKVLTCPFENLEIRKPVTLRMVGNMTSAWTGQTKQKRLQVNSAASLNFDENLYIHLFTTAQHRYTHSQATTEIELYEEVNILPLVLGGGIGGLLLLAIVVAVLYKVGFFKRQYQDLMNEANNSTDNMAAATENENFGQVQEERAA
ncbi:integrin alpha-X-like [Polypterus senegalus]|uniref:integrin alpha-X-like n=1 Tax=Polypterus senegalus TaxID=55291 RepID=UPI001965F4E1|nr:integrin alpha-X-like [Polypterus senegalus]